MTRRKRIVGAIATLATVMSMIPLMALPAGAITGPQPVATGLNGPYKLTQGPDGAIYVAEAGTGGSTCAEVVGPEGEEVEACAGLTGSVTRIAGGTHTRTVTGLPSVNLGSELIGPTAVDFDSGGTLHVLVGLGGASASRDTYGDDRFGTLLRITGGTAQVVSDLVAFEEAEDPDAGLPGTEAPDSNPFGLAFDGADALVADAGGNSLLRVKPDGTTTVEAVFPPKLVDPPPFLPIPGQMPMQAVPTTVERAGGTTLVATLTGFPFEVGAAAVYQVSGGNVTVRHGGFTNIIDMAVADDGTIYVLEFATNSLLQGPLARLVEVRTDGTQKTLLYGDDLPVPGGIAVGDDGMLYISVCTLCGPGQGMVWRFDPSKAADAATAAACSPADVPGSGFRDIADSTHHREAIECAAWWGVVNGYSPTTFGPGDSVSREQVASMLVRSLYAAGLALVQGAPDAFGDDDGSVHEADINVLASMDVIRGRGDGIFDPKAPVTRAEMASLVARAYAVAAEQGLAAGTDAFTDDNGSVHEDDIDAVAAAGWVNGVGAGSYDPNGHTTRAQLTSIVMRMMSTLVAGGVATLPAD